MDIRPNHTIYINNLNEKIKKDGKERWRNLRLYIIYDDSRLSLLKLPAIFYFLT